MQTKHVFLIMGVIAFSCAVLLFAAFHHARKSIIPAEAQIQIAANLLWEESERIKDFIKRTDPADLKDFKFPEEIKIIQAEKWKESDSALILWMTNVRCSDKEELVRNSYYRDLGITKFNPLKNVYVKGDLYNGKFFVFEDSSGTVIRYETELMPDRYLKSFSDIFDGKRKYAAGPLEQYDIWRKSVKN